MLANSADSISDVLTSSAIIIATLLGALLLKENYFYLDAAMGIIVSIIICINGFKIVLETIGDLLGRPADKEQLEELESVIMSSDKILGIHDLIIHDYGPGRKFASVHAEVDSKSDVIEAHEIIDEIEQICYGKTGIELVIHMDPIDTTSPTVLKAKEVIGKVIEEYEGVSYHDLRITDGEHNINVIFDLVVPHQYENDKLKELVSTIKSKVKEQNNKYTLVIKVDRPYVE